MFDATYARRRPAPGLIFHSDRGSEYAAATLRGRLRALSVAQSSTTRGLEDDAHMESLFHSLTAELIDGATFATDAGPRAAFRRYVAYYNRRRLHFGAGVPVADGL